MRDRYGVIMNTGAQTDEAWFLQNLGMQWYLDFNRAIDTIPPGKKKLLFVPGPPGPSAQELQAVAQAAPGSVWYVIGEPNRMFPVTSQLVTQWRDLYQRIKSADPTAKVTSPSVLNWDFTCYGCGGYQSGHSWMQQFIDEYQRQFHAPPPFDIWAIDTYPLDWWNIPTTNENIVIDQVKDMRSYMDANGFQNKPIWVTELSMHWGYDCQGKTPGQVPYQCFKNGDATQGPTDGLPYLTDQVTGYLNRALDWFEANAATFKIEKWFIFITYSDLGQPNDGAYQGISLFNGPSARAPLSPVGEALKQRIQALP